MPSDISNVHSKKIDSVIFTYQQNSHRILTSLKTKKIIKGYMNGTSILLTKKDANLI